MDKTLTVTNENDCNKFDTQNQDKIGIKLHLSKTYIKTFIQSDYDRGHKLHSKDQD